MTSVVHLTTNPMQTTVWGKRAYRHSIDAVTMRVHASVHFTARIQDHDLMDPNNMSQIGPSDDGSADELLRSPVASSRDRQSRLRRASLQRQSLSNNSSPRKQSKLVTPLDADHVRRSLDQLTLLDDYFQCSSDKYSKSSSSPDDLQSIGSKSLNSRSVTDLSNAERSKAEESLKQRKKKKKTKKESSRSVRSVSPSPSTASCRYPEDPPEIRTDESIRSVLSIDRMYTPVIPIIKNKLRYSGDNPLTAPEFSKVVSFSHNEPDVLEIPLLDPSLFDACFYDEDELAEFRYEAFCEEAGLNPADYD